MPAAEGGRTQIAPSLRFRTPVTVTQGTPDTPARSSRRHDSYPPPIPTLVLYHRRRSTPEPPIPQASTAIPTRPSTARPSPPDPLRTASPPEHHPPKYASSFRAAEPQPTETPSPLHAPHPRPERPPSLNNPPSQKPNLRNRSPLAPQNRPRSKPDDTALQNFPPKPPNNLLSNLDLAPPPDPKPSKHAPTKRADSTPPNARTSDKPRREPFPKNPEIRLTRNPRTHKNKNHKKPEPLRNQKQWGRGYSEIPACACGIRPTQTQSRVPLMRPRNAIGTPLMRP